MTDFFYRRGFIVVLLLFGGALPSQALLGRDKVASRWPDGAVQIDGRAREWSEMPVLESGGVSFRAMNDASNLYLLIQGANDDGRVLFSGKFRQNVILWFLKGDEKTKTWGIDLDFSRMHPPDPGVPPTLSAFGISPEKVLSEGLEVSTATFPSEIELQADLSSEHGRQAVYEIRIPLNMMDAKGKSIFADFVSSAVSPEVKAEFQSKPTEAPTAGGSSFPGGGRMGGGRRGRGMGGSSGAGASRTVEFPKPLDLHLTVELSKEPKR